MGVGIANGQGESLVRFFMSGFANSPKSDRSSGEERVRRFISIVFLQNWPKSDFEIVVRVERKKISAANIPNGVRDVSIGTS